MSENSVENKASLHMRQVACQARAYPSLGR